VSAGLEFGILGPVEAWRGDARIDLGRPKQRALLTVLILGVDQVVSPDRLQLLLWGDRASPRSTGAIQSYVSNLRRALEPDRPSRAPARILLSQAGGYRLAVEASVIDATRFETATAAGLRLLAEERPVAARDALAAALALWRGPALADFACDEFARLEAARLEELRLVALEAKLDADLALGGHLSAVPELERLVADHPLRERLWASLMLALYRCGRQADALRAYQGCRVSLAADLGLDPGPGLRRLEAAVLAQDAALDWRAPPNRSTERHCPPAGPVTDAAGAGLLVGRAGPLARLEAAWHRAAAGAGGFILVTGEAGIGKTRLAEELATIAAGTGARVAWGRSYEAEAPAFWPWSQILKTLLAECSAETVAEVLQGVGLAPSDLAPVVPLEGPEGTAGPVAALDPVDARFRLYRAVSAVVQAAAAERPVALFLDDLNWADVPSLQLLRFLATELGNRPIAVVLTYRHGEARDRLPVTDTLGELARHRVLERSALGGLGAGDVEQFIAGVTGAYIGPKMAAAVHRRTEGNPFFMTEVVRLLESEGALADADSHAAIQVPAGVRDVTRRRLSHLAEPSQRVLQLAAVAGHEFDVGVLAVAQGTDEATMLEALEPALICGVVVEAGTTLGQHRFSHALVRDALYDDLSGVGRARLHAQVAEALEVRQRGDEGAAEIAHHLFLARQIVGAERCIPPLLRAADLATNRLAHEQAEHHLRQALELLASLPASAERDRRELWVQTRLGLILGTTAGLQTPEATTVFARSRALCASTGDVGVELPDLYGLFLFAWSGADEVAAHHQADQLLDLAAHSEDPKYLLGGHLAKGLVLFDQGALPPAGRHFERVGVLADSLADPWLASVLYADPRVTGRLLRSQVLALTGPFEQSHYLATAGLELARRIEHPFT